VYYKTQKLLAKRSWLEARGRNKYRFCIGLGIRGIGGDAIALHSQ